VSGAGDLSPTSRPISTTVDLGDPGLDNTYGNGRLDLASAYQCLKENICVHRPQFVPQSYLPLIFQDSVYHVLRFFFPFIAADGTF